MISIPSEYLAKMGVYSIKIEGNEIKVKVADIFSPSVVKTRIIEMRSLLMKSTSSALRVVGVDVKNLSTYQVVDHIHKLLVLCTGADCLIIHLGPEYSRSDVKAPEELIQFLGDTSVCFVGSTTRPYFLASTSSRGATAGDLAAMVLKKPSLIRSTLPEIAREAGVHYEGPTESTGESLKVETIDPFVLSEDQVKLAVSNAYYYYKIGHKLLSSL